MSNGRLTAPCPSCGHALTVWRVMAYPVPWVVKCGACRKPLLSRSGVLWGLVLSIVAAAIVVLAMRPSLAAHQWLRASVMAVVVLGALEFFVSWAVIALVRSSRT